MFGNGNVIAIHSTTREILWEVAANGPGPWNFSIGNVDDINGKEIIWGTGYPTPTSKSALTIFEPQSQEIKF